VLVEVLVLVDVLVLVEVDVLVLVEVLLVVVVVGGTNVILILLSHGPVEVTVNIVAASGTSTVKDAGASI
jgi:hypothetical protein